MAKTVHVILSNGAWTVKRATGTKTLVFSTQREAIESARTMLRGAQCGQLVVHGRDGRIKEHDTYGMPPIQDPPGRRSAKIEKAVGKITRDRLLGGGLNPGRG